MKLLIWGVSCVGKTTIGKEISKRLNYDFYDIDEELIKKYGSIDEFQLQYPDRYDRFNIKKEIMLRIINNQNNFIMAVSPIFSCAIVDEILRSPSKSIELIDTPENIFKRMILDGDEDEAFKNAYKEKYKNHYINEIKLDLTASYAEFKNIFKIDIRNLDVTKSADKIIDIIKNKKKWLK